MKYLPWRSTFLEPGLCMNPSCLRHNQMILVDKLRAKWERLPRLCSMIKIWYDLLELLAVYSVNTYLQCLDFQTLVS